jgi:hypothetical protein
VQGEKKTSGHGSSVMASKHWSTAFIKLQLRPNVLIMSPPLGFTESLLTS